MKKLSLIRVIRGPKSAKVELRRCKHTGILTHGFRHKLFKLLLTRYRVPTGPAVNDLPANQVQHDGFKAEGTILLRQSRGLPPKDTCNVSL